EASLGFLAAADVADWPADALAGCLRALGRAESAQLAARSRVMSAFSACGGFEADGQPTVRTWLRWQTQITNAASYGAAGWMRRLAVHPRVCAALGAAQVTSSFARLICDWSELLPPGLRDEADAILLAAAAGGATQADLAMLAQQMLERSAPPDSGGPDGGAGDDDGFRDRRVWLDLHFRGAGKLNGDLTPECAAALTAMLDALGKKAGPEDTRTTAQRHHDALEEACRRLIAGGLPDTAGQPTQVQLHVTLDQLRDLPGAAAAERSWAAARAAADGTPGWVHGRAAAEAYACDAQLIPVVTGHLDPGVLDAATGRYLAGFRRPDCQCGGCTCPPGPGAPPGHGGPAGPGGQPGPDGLAGPQDPGARPCGPPPLSPRTRRRLASTVLAYAADILSGPAGLAAFLRTGLLANDFPATASLPLDTGTPTATVPPHLRRLVILRDRHCAFPGCRQKPVNCQAHHLIPRAKGGVTALHNLALLCLFHHLIAVHRWGWTLALNPDGTTTATSPDGQRVYHSHGPPQATEA
ncbi:MAG TPA: DUF222 domain-containing protein, partial [Streptosporangiaceae bacterium]|nr:DUF222 domain-containing protein [Streptosporangiaceae bacterium]